MTAMTSWEHDSEYQATTLADVREEKDGYAIKSSDGRAGGRATRDEK